MRMRFIPLGTIPLVLLLVPGANVAKQPPVKYQLTIVYTNDVQGEIEPCG